MNCSLLRWLAKPQWGIVASLALLANSALAQDSPSQAPFRSATSKHADKQVRLPEDNAPDAEPAKLKRPSPPTKQQASMRPTAQRVVGADPVHRDANVRGVQHIAPGPQHARAAAMRRQAPVQRTASRTLGTRTRALATQGERMMQDGEVIMDGDMPAEMLPTPTAGDMIMPDGADMHGPMDGSCDDCGNCGHCTDCCLIPCPRLCFDNFEFFAGTQGVTGPATRGEGASFGFHEGVNWGRELRLPCRPDCYESWLSGQLGFRATQSAFSGSDITEDDRRQFFVTGGLFRRVDWGLQGGVVVDYLHDEWYYDGMDLLQVRGELSWMFPCQDELGFWFTQGINNATTQSVFQATPNVVTTQSESWVATDLYAFFYRRHFVDCNATGRIFAGFTGEADGLVGADLNLPIAERWAVRTDFAYLIPTEGNSTGGNAEESWNIGLSLVWYPGCRTARSQDYHRPLFDVGHNGSFMVDRE
jgi:hypothetical protein